MTIEKKSAMIASILLVGVLAYSFVSAKISERHGAGKEEVTFGKAQVKNGVDLLKAAETVYVHDTVRFARAVKQYDTLKVTERITDTVWVKQFIVAADSVKKACSDAILSCDQKDSAHRVIEAGLRAINDGLKKELPTRTEKVVGAGKWMLIGAGIEAVAAHALHR